MANGHVLISSQTLASAVASVTFSSIPSTYRDLMVVMQGDLVGNTYWNIQFNGDTTAANYPYVAMNGGAATTLGTNFYNVWFNGLRNQAILHVLDYSATDKHKTLIGRNNTGGSANNGTAGAQRWASTAAVTSVTLNGNANFNSGCIFYLFGVAG